jgi:hypothetical protein
LWRTPCWHRAEVLGACPLVLPAMAGLCWQSWRVALFIMATMCHSKTQSKHKLDADLKQSSEAVDIKITASYFIMFILKNLKKSLCDNTFYVQKALDSIVRKVRNTMQLKNGTLLVEVFNKQ